MFYIGIDLGGTNVAIGIVDSNYNIIIKGSVPTGASRGGEEIVKDMASLCERLVSDAGLTFDDIEYVGIGAPSAVDAVNGTLIYTNNLPLDDFPISDRLKSYIPIKRVLLENDANAAALGEVVAGAAKGVKHAVVVTLGTGVGGGIVIDGKIYSGHNFAAGELGHMVIEHNGVPCSCGRRGCWESYSSATGLIRMTKEKISDCEKRKIPTLMAQNSGKVSGRTAFDAMRAGDIPAKEVVDTYISYLACGLVNVIDIFQPEVLVIGGGICNEKNYLTDPLNAIIEKEVYKGIPTRNTVLKIAELGNDAGIIGAAALGL